MSGQSLTILIGLRYRRNTAGTNVPAVIYASQRNVSSSSVKRDMAFLWDCPKFDHHKIQTPLLITIKQCIIDYVHEENS